MSELSEKRQDELLSALDKLGDGSKFLWLVFTLTLTPTVFNGLQSMSYVFTTEIPPYWCTVPELVSANWTSEEIRRISSAGECIMYNYDYKYLARLGYEEAVKYVEDLSERPGSSSCSSFIFGDVGRSTVVQEWDLVCTRAADRANTFMAFSLGKLMGSGIFGVYADKSGRRRTFIIGIILQILSGPASALVPWFWGYMGLRWITGLSSAAVGYSSLTILTEVSGSRHRQWLGIAFNAGYPIGTAILAGLAYQFRDWRNLQMAISLGSLLLIIHACLMPESPRWLITQNRREEARKIIEKYYGPVPTTPVPMSMSSDQRNNKQNGIHEEKKENFIQRNMKSLRILFSNSELRKRLIIMYLSWLTSSLSYYAIALNADNFTDNHYLYVLIMGFTEIPAYIIPSIILMFLGRRAAGSLLYILGAVCLLCILAIPQDLTGAIMGVALTGRFTLSAVYGIVILYTSELFPTVARNSAVGTSCVMAHVGTIIAPYVSDLLGSVAWWAPSTICGSLALVSGILCLGLPETRGRGLADTVEEETGEGRENTSFKKCFPFYSGNKEFQPSSNN
ncbi:organic cation transporter protein [Fopius arisanus]|uniref:Organic cation transporter protein n=3 Tax=Fopius arisanus TaxID=64838 RepID=A0A9R1T469_9HYME|nr:PREDICTED: organic cation transporter protein [Fopius arisanus]